jgi:hypothetical protein
MAHTFEYAVLTAIPDPRRGERVNVGMAIFREDRVDVRFEQAVYKIRALTGDNWSARVESAEARYKSLFNAKEKPDTMLKRFERVEPLLKPSGTGWFAAENDEQYEQRVAEILQSLVCIPKRAPVVGKSRINTEMAKEFRRAKILANENQDISAGKIVRNFTIDDSEGLVADFALKNGKMHVASTLDLRKQSAGMGEAALKSIILDKAKKKYRGRAKTIGVYAMDPGMTDAFRPQLKLLCDYADELYDWQDGKSRKQLARMFYDAMGQPSGALL